MNQHAATSLLWPSRLLRLLTEAALYACFALVVFFSFIPDGSLMFAALVERALFFIGTYSVWGVVLWFVKNSFRRDTRSLKALENPAIRFIGLLILGSVSLFTLSYLKERYPESLFQFVMAILAGRAIQVACEVRGKRVSAHFAEAITLGAIGYLSFVLVSLDWPWQAILPAASFSAMVLGVRCSEIAVERDSNPSLSRAGLMGLFLAPALILISHSLGLLPGSYLSQIALAPLLLILATWQQRAATNPPLPQGYLSLVRVTFLSYLAIIALSKIMG